MGTTQTKSKKEDFSFGSYKDPSNPRPGYFISKDKVFYRGTIVSGADSKTFVKMKHGWAKDKNGKYYNGKRSSG